ncbi:flavoprotein-like protein [Hyaloscypha finlandica]|nr:flavoprotein-like protein [Hyaloscypha finlandica]
MAPKVAIVFKLAEAEKEGLKKAGIEADLFQVAETLPQEVLTKMYAPPKSDIPIIDAKTLESYDAFLIGIPTRYGNFPAQWKAFWDTTGGQWGSGGYYGKYAGVFVSTGTPGGGQESTVIAAMSTMAHHGIIYVPLGYAKTFPQLTNVSEVRGGSPWGAGTFAGADGSRSPSALELELATIQGETFGKHILKSETAAVAKKEQNTQQKPKTDTNGTSGEPEAKDKEGPCGLPAKCSIL